MTTVEQERHAIDVLAAELAPMQAELDWLRQRIRVLERNSRTHWEWILVLQRGR